MLKSYTSFFPKQNMLLGSINNSHKYIVTTNWQSVDMTVSE